MLDLMLEVPMSEIWKKIPLDSETKAVLRGDPSLLRPIYQLMRAHESGGEWERLAPPARVFLWMPAPPAASYWQPQPWARGVSSGA
jgi:hypothetical protein